MSYYEPTLLFRSNAIRKSPYSSQNSTESQVNLQYKPTPSNWIFNAQNDTSILNKVCCLDRLNIKSNYWKIPDEEMNLTSLAITSNNNNNNTSTVAISSGGKANNLFVYQLDMANNYLTHNNTILLANIHAMKWVPKSASLLMAGNSKGYGHLISIPDAESDDSSEVLKRFNHRKHLKSINIDPSIYSHHNTLIEKMGFRNSNQLITIYDNNLFDWDLHDSTLCTKPKPNHITSINGLENFDINHFDNNLLGIVGSFGISLYDLREPRFLVPEISKRNKNRRQIQANIIKWDPNNEYVFAAGHMDGIIRLWDIRKQSNYGKLVGHNGKIVNALDWIDGDLFSGGKDGNIIHWDLTSDIIGNDDLLNCGLKEGIKSVNFNAMTNCEAITNQRQCGTLLPASNSNIIHLETMETFDDLKVLSIDGSSYFGLHSKIYEAVNMTSKDFYSKDDVDMLMAQGSDMTLIDDESIHSLETVDSLVTTEFEFTKPLTINMAKPNNSSNDTLIEMDTKSSKFTKTDFKHSYALEKEFINQSFETRSYQLPEIHFDQFQFVV